MANTEKKTNHDKRYLKRYFGLKKYTNDPIIKRIIKSPKNDLK